MDLFGRKAKARIAELEIEVKALRKDRADLAHALRELDQGVFNMAQKPNWDTMRPIFAKLCEMTNVRMKIESDRIAGLITSELERTYGS